MRKNVIQFEGAYVLQEKPEAPAVPVVYLISAESESAARKIHQFVWNQNQTPFLIIESPTTVRLYSGFSFKQGENESIVQATRGIADEFEALEDVLRLSWGMTYKAAAAGVNLGGGVLRIPANPSDAIDLKVTVEFEEIG